MSTTRSNFSRREFLNYAWLASIALFAIEGVGLGLWFALPNAKAGQPGGLYPLGRAGDLLPDVNQPPVAVDEGKFWLVNLDSDLNGVSHQG